MKKLLTIFLFIPFICHGQSKAQLQDSVKKYDDIGLYYFESYRLTSDSGVIVSQPYFDKEKYFQHKVDVINAHEQAIQDSVNWINRKRYLETKYKIKLP